MTDNITDVAEQTEVPSDPQLSFLDNLVGDGRKYKSPEELARAYHNADLHIRELRDELREEREDKGVMKEVLTELRTPARADASEAQTNNVSSTPSNPEDVKTLVREAMTEQERERIARQNMQTSMSLLTEAYGSQEAAMQAVRNYMGNDEAKKELVNRVGNTDPEALKNLILVKTPVVTPAEPNTPGIKDAGSANTVLSAGNELTWSKCREVKKSDPNLYNSPEFRKRMEAASAADPDFFNK